MLNITTICGHTQPRGSHPALGTCPTCQALAIMRAKSQLAAATAARRAWEQAHTPVPVNVVPRTRVWE